MAPEVKPIGLLWSSFVRLAGEDLWPAASRIANDDAGIAGARDGRGRRCNPPWELALCLARPGRLFGRGRGPRSVWM